MMPRPCIKKLQRFQAKEHEIFKFKMSLFFLICFLSFFIVFVNSLFCFNCATTNKSSHFYCTDSFFDISPESEPENTETEFEEFSLYNRYEWAVKCPFEKNQWCLKKNLIINGIEIIIRSCASNNLRQNELEEGCVTYTTNKGKREQIITSTCWCQGDYCNKSNNLKRNSVPFYILLFFLFYQKRFSTV